MKQIKYISPTSLGLFYQDRDAYYMTYLSDNPVPREPQTQPMSVGSAFDVYVKKELSKDLGILFEGSVEEQVEAHNLEWALEHGKIVFDQYVASGAYENVLGMIDRSIIKPRFEFQVCRELGDCVILGKPDLYFVTEDEVRVVLDWKVNGYCAIRTTYPKGGYIQLWPDRVVHKDAQLHRFGDLDINISKPFEAVDERWARQLTMYAWSLGFDDKFVLQVEQLVCNSGVVKVATHRSRVSKEFEEGLRGMIIEMWDIIKSGWVFRELSERASHAKQAEMDKADNYYMEMQR